MVTCLLSFIKLKFIVLVPRQLNILNTFKKKDLNQLRYTIVLGSDFKVDDIDDRLDKCNKQTNKL